MWLMEMNKNLFESVLFSLLTCFVDVSIRLSFDAIMKKKSRSFYKQRIYSDRTVRWHMWQQFCQISVHHDIYYRKQS